MAWQEKAFGNSVIISGCPPSKAPARKKEEEQSPVSWWRGTLIVSAISPRRRSSPRPIISVGSIRILISTTRWSAIRIIAVTATSGWWIGIFNGGASRARWGWRTVAAVTGVVIITGWGATTIIVTTGAVATGRRRATAVIAVRWWITTAPTEWWGRARAVAVVVAGNLVLGLYLGSVVELIGGMSGKTYIS